MSIEMYLNHDAGSDLTNGSNVAEDETRNGSSIAENETSIGSSVNQ